MKNQIRILLLLAVLISACTSEKGVKPKPYVVQGIIETWDSGWIYLQHRAPGKYITDDSVLSIDGAFMFKGKIDYPRMSYVKLEGVKGIISFFLEAAEINISASPEKPADAQITGSASHDVLKKYQDESGMFSLRTKALSEAYDQAEANNDKAKMDELMQEYEKIQQDEKEHLLGFIKANPTSVVSAYLSLRNLHRLELQDIETVAANIPVSLSGAESVVQLNERIEALQSVQIGQKAPDFVMNDSTGNALSLWSLQGNYLLVDFWASWCGPCRAENPNVVAAYQKYCTKGFDILGVSLDTDRERWIKAIHDDNLTWHHVSDLKGWGNDAAKQYAVNSIPANILLDPQGVIIARNLRENALHDKLEELLGEVAEKQ